MKKIGLAIALGKEANSHTRTFIEAINHSLKHFPEFKQNIIKIANDEKSIAGGEKAAIELIKWGADIVVGHFSSFAALAALPLYAKNAIPLILPASTACELNVARKKNNAMMFKYQKNNAALMAHCIEECVSNNNGGAIYAIVQDNEYGNRLIEYIPLLRGITIIRSVPKHIELTDNYIIIGHSDFAAHIVKVLTQVRVYRVILIDDSDCHEVLQSFILRPHRISRVRSVSHITRDSRNRPYWNETLLALALASSNDVHNCYDLNERNNINTYLGLQDFDSENCYGDVILMTEDLD
ncbi:Receptor family ligand binding region [Serratia entomophila]|uniref:hypothetical protein n=1 Tax=Serratia entomophila TaxID=42906 RepID=UPI002177EA32|nr:hypothetical protein [Serratia entomophila]CAI1908160.1 Receptor family ligand binding region [Serratia entomophila]